MKKKFLIILLIALPVAAITAFYLYPKFISKNENKLCDKWRKNQEIPNACSCTVSDDGGSIDIFYRCPDSPEGIKDIRFVIIDRKTGEMLNSGASD